MRIRNVSPLGDVFNPLTGSVPAGGVVEVADKLVEDFGLLASGHFEQVKDKPAAKKAAGSEAVEG